MTQKSLKIGTRGSPLALWQAEWVRARLLERYPDHEISLVKIKTAGDRILDVPLAQVGGKGLFVKEIEDAMLRGDIDLAVHSMKDVPGEIPDGLIFAAILPREDVRDILVSRGNVKIELMPMGAKIGTGSLRRGAQLQAMMPDVTILPLRGNVDTRLKKIETEDLNGVILAAAGMKRLGYGPKIAQYLPVELMLPAVGQGAIGLQIREADSALAGILAKINHAPTAAEIAAERAYLRALGGGCRLPIAAYCKYEGAQLSLDGLVAAPDGAVVIRDRIRGPVEEAEELGARLAALIMERGGKKLLNLCTES